MGKLRSIAVLVLALAFTLSGIALAGETLGKIQAINPTTKQILLDNGSALAVDRDTKIMVEGKEGNLEDLNASDQVRASFQEKDGKSVATTLDIRASGPGSVGGQGTMGSQGASTYGNQGSSMGGGQKKQ